MNRLKYIKAEAHPDGNRVDICWLNPNPLEYHGVRVVGRENTHPMSFDDGHLVAEISVKPLFKLDLSYSHHLDNNIVSPQLSVQFIANGIMVTTNAAAAVIQPGNRWEIMEDGVFLVIRNNDLLEIYGLDRANDINLPYGKIFYYTLFPYRGEPHQYEFIPSNRAACFATESMDYAGRMYKLLPVIYHRYDTRLAPSHLAEKAGMSEIDKQYGQLRRFLELTGPQFDQFHSFADAALNLHDMRKVDGNLLPLLAQWIGWPTLYNAEVAGQRNEIRYAPDLCRTIGLIPNLETISRLISGLNIHTREMAENVFLTNSTEELNSWLAYRDETGTWTAEKEVFSLDTAYEGRPAAVRDDSNVLWLFYHTQRNNDWDIWYKTYREDQGWTPSKPLTGIPNIDKHPTAVLQDKTLIVFWNSFDKTNNTWSIRYCRNNGGTWSEIQNFDHGIPGGSGSGTGSQRKSPCTVVDPDNKLWLFWLEPKIGTDQWQLKINRYDGSQWELPEAEDFPLENGADPRVGTDLFLFHRVTGTGPSLCLTWTRNHIDANGVITGKEIVFREKTGLSSVTGAWGPVRVMPKIQAPFLYHDSDPYALAMDNGEVELYWSSNRSGAWAIWNTRLTDLSAIDSSAAVRVIQGFYSQRYPAAFQSNGGVYLVYRSNQGISYQGAVSRKTGEADFRRAGCLAVDERDRHMNVRSGNFNDCLTYTYDTGKNGVPDNNTWYACDTVGIYITPDSVDVEATLKKIKTLQDLIGQYMPLHTRPVFIVKPFVADEPIYTYDLPLETKKSVIIEKMNDIIREKARTEAYPGVTESNVDKAPSWSLLHSWSTATPANTSADLNSVPPESTSRSWHIALEW
jgi:hypothetical protein